MLLLSSRKKNGMLSSDYPAIMIDSILSSNFGSGVIPNWLDNKFKVEHYRRIAYANKKFASKVPGWRTDRGMIYILLGPPDQIDSPAPNGKLFSEIWHYHELARPSSSKKVVLEFVDKSRTNDYQLTTDSTVKALLDWINMPHN